MLWIGTSYKLAPAGELQTRASRGGNQETRINTSPQIKRVNIDPILTVATVEQPDAAEIYDVKIAGIAENIGNITHTIEDLNAANEVKDPAFPAWIRNAGQPFDSIHYMNVHNSYLRAHNATPDTFYDGTIDSNSFIIH